MVSALLLCLFFAVIRSSYLLLRVFLGYCAFTCSSLRVPFHITKPTSTRLCIVTRQHARALVTARLLSGDLALQFSIPLALQAKSYFDFIVSRCQSPPTWCFLLHVSCFFAFLLSSVLVCLWFWLAISLQVHAGGPQPSIIDSARPPRRPGPSVFGTTGLVC